MTPVPVPLSLANPPFATPNGGPLAGATWPGPRLTLGQTAATNAAETATTGVAGDAPAGRAAAPPPQGSTIGSLILPLAVGLAFYFILIRPLSKEQSSQRAALAELKRNDKVVTQGGIVGIVTSTPGDSDEITIKSDERKLIVRRDAIREIVPKTSKGSQDGKDASGK